jgi:phage terminase large subunit GpA-like protein
MGRRPSLQEFMETEVGSDSGPLNFRGREALLGPMAHLDEVLRLGLPEQTVSILKGTQIGMTSVAIGLALYCVRVRRLNVGYFLPDQDFANRFADTRIRPAIRNPRLAAAMRDGRYRGAASKGLKEFPAPGGSRFLYVLGLQDIGNAISLPLDVLIRDEVDDLPPENLAWSNDRLDASRIGLTVNLAMGRTPGRGIHAMYEDGDRRTWRVPCFGCQSEWTLEEHWPEVLADALADDGGPPRLVCPSCGAHLSRSAGRWAPAGEPALRSHASWRIPQLAVEAIRLERIAAKWRAARRPGEAAKFRCSALALPDAGESRPIDAALISRLRETAPYQMERPPA